MRMACCACCLGKLFSYVLVPQSPSVFVVCTLAAVNAYCMLSLIDAWDDAGKIGRPRR